MSVELEQLRSELGISQDRATHLGAVLAEAKAIVAQITVGTPAIPGPILDRAIVLTAGDLWQLRQAPNGVRSFQDANGTQAIRVNRDPATRARGLLALWLRPGMA